MGLRKQVSLSLKPKYHMPKSIGLEDVLQRALAPLAVVVTALAEGDIVLAVRPIPLSPCAALGRPGDLQLARPGQVRLAVRARRSPHAQNTPTDPARSSPARSHQVSEYRSLFACSSSVARRPQQQHLVRERHVKKERTVSSTCKLQQKDLNLCMA